MSDLAGLLQRLVATLGTAGVPYMVAGSFASTAHGLPRATQDLDIVIDPPDQRALDALLDGLPPTNYYVDVDAARDALQRRTMFNVIDNVTGWKVDLIVRKNRAFSREEFRRRQPMTMLGIAVFVASPEDTIIAKLEWSLQAGGSERQRRDIAGVLEMMGGKLDTEYVARWVTDLGLADEWEGAKAGVRT